MHFSKAMGTAGTFNEAPEFMIDHNISRQGQNDLGQAIRQTNSHMKRILDPRSGALRISLSSDKSLTIFEPQASRVSNGGLCVFQGPVEVTDKIYVRGCVDSRALR